MVYTSGLGASDLSPEASFNAINDYFDGSYFTGEMPYLSFPFFPYMMGVDLETMEIVGMDSSSSYLSISDITSLLNAANAD